MSGELSEFEQKSSLTPKNAPYGILGGAVFALIIFILVSMFSKNEAVEDLDKAGEDSAAETKAAAPAAPSGEVDDI